MKTIFRYRKFFVAISLMAAIVLMGCSNTPTNDAPAGSMDQTNPGAQFDAGIMSVDLFQQGQENGEIRSDLLFGAKIFFERCLEDDPLFPHAKDNLNIINKVAEYYN